jgi:hypothetical protein
MTNKDLALYGGLLALGAFAIYEVVNNDATQQGLAQAIYFTGVLGGTVAVVALTTLFL